jgi:hypothetical protein
LCATKRFKGKDAQTERCFVIMMSNLVEFLVVRLLFWREEEEMTS